MINANEKLTDGFLGLRGDPMGVVFEVITLFGRAKDQKGATETIGIFQFRLWKPVVYDPTFLHRCLTLEHCSVHVCVLQTLYSLSLGMLLHLLLGSL